MSIIEGALKEVFQKHRIIFWYDEEARLTEEYDQVALQNVDKITVGNNQFWLQYHITKEKPSEKFLLYFPFARPKNIDNWLLDIELANYVFFTEEEAMYTRELEMDMSLRDVVREHLDFYKSKERRARLKEQLSKGETSSSLKHKMIGVHLNADNYTLASYIHLMTKAFLEEDNKVFTQLEKYNLNDFFWKQVEKHYNYISESPSIYGFLLEVFSRNSPLIENYKNDAESKILLSLWKDSFRHQDIFKSIATKIAEHFQVVSILNKKEVEELLNEDLFKETDKRIIYILIQRLVSNDLPNNRLQQMLRERQNKFWYKDHEDLYNTLRHAGQLFESIAQFKEVQFKDFNDGFKLYQKRLYTVDFHYRKFIEYYRLTNQNSVFEPLCQKVLKVYNNDWLLEINDKWSAQINQIKSWPTFDSRSQSKFFYSQVRPYLEKGQKLFVIITDAMRFEIGWELSQQINGENRFDADLDYMIGCLPSYTQLGMASLLPHKKVQFKEGTSDVLVDGFPSKGVEDRSAILSKDKNYLATAIAAEDFMRLNTKTEGRDLMKGNDLIYIYHNRIDLTGDKRVTEDKLTEAASEEITYLIDILKKISNMNGTNILITTDHGFLYQYDPVETSDFSIEPVKGDVWGQSSRYVVGQNFTPSSGYHHFKSEDIGVEGAAEILIPKSVKRIKNRGSGSRYVHGGASLQEIVLPMISVKKKRSDTVKKVDIDIIKSTDKITSNIFIVSFIQSELVSEKVLPRNIRAAFHAEDGELLSDFFTYEFNFREGTERSREAKHRFQMNSLASGKYKNQPAKLVLGEQVTGSNEWKKYKEYNFTLIVSYASEFDEW